MAVRLIRGDLCQGAVAFHEFIELPPRDPLPPIGREQWSWRGSTNGEPGIQRGPLHVDQEIFARSGALEPVDEKATYVDTVVGELQQSGF